MTDRSCRYSRIEKADGRMEEAPNEEHPQRMNAALRAEIDKQVHVWRTELRLSTWEIDLCLAGARYAVRIMSKLLNEKTCGKEINHDGD